MWARFLQMFFIWFPKFGLKIFKANPQSYIWTSKRALETLIPWLPDWMTDFLQKLLEAYIHTHFRPSNEKQSHFYEIIFFFFKIFDFYQKHWGSVTWIVDWEMGSIWLQWKNFSRIQFQDNMSSSHQVPSTAQSIRGNSISWEIFPGKWWNRTKHQCSSFFLTEWQLLTHSFQKIAMYLQSQSQNLDPFKNRFRPFAPKLLFSSPQKVDPLQCTVTMTLLTDLTKKNQNGPKKWPNQRVPWNMQCSRSITLTNSKTE